MSNTAHFPTHRTFTHQFLMQLSHHRTFKCLQKDVYSQPFSSDIEFMAANKKQSNESIRNKIQRKEREREKRGAHKQ